MQAHPIPRAGRYGFSLVELLLVILIVSILMGLTLVGAQYALKKSYASKTQVQLKVLEGGLEKFQTDRMEYPNPIKENSAKDDTSTKLYIALTGDGITQADIDASNDSDAKTKPGYAGVPDGQLTDLERKWGTYVEELLSPAGSKSLQKWVEAGTYRIVDGFGEGLQYRCELTTDGLPVATQNNPSYDLWSYGTDSVTKRGGTTTDTNVQDKWLKNW